MKQRSKFLRICKVILSCVWGWPLLQALLPVKLFPMKAGEASFSMDSWG